MPARPPTSRRGPATTARQSPPRPRLSEMTGRTPFSAATEGRRATASAVHCEHGRSRPTADPAIRPRRPVAGPLLRGWLGRATVAGRARLRGLPGRARHIARDRVAGGIVSIEVHGSCRERRTGRSPARGKPRVALLRRRPLIDSARNCFSAGSGVRSALHDGVFLYDMLHRVRHGHAGRRRGQRQDGPLHAPLGVHARRDRPLERDRQRDDRGVGRIANSE